MLLFSSFRFLIHLILALVSQYPRIQIYFSVVISKFKHRPDLASYFALCEILSLISDRSTWPSFQHTFSCVSIAFGLLCLSKWLMVFDRELNSLHKLYVVFYLSKAGVFNLWFSIIYTVTGTGDQSEVCFKASFTHTFGVHAYWNMNLLSRNHSTQL